ncbi:MAG: hypothetical protein IPL49_11840 [Saprospirales bacterium]|nr:hypothetical protein [Saprospirales bacterium]MBK8491542.1 hypothetical protein [Saprospirales bacterium]
MKPTTQRVLYWAPRLLTILFAAFISIFALDVFDGSQDIWKTLAALAIHLIPTLLIVLVLVLAWRWEWVGTVVFLALGIAYLITTWGRFHWSAYVVISGSLFLLGGLFWASWKMHARKSTN